MTVQIMQAEDSGASGSLQAAPGGTQIGFAETRTFKVSESRVGTCATDPVACFENEDVQWIMDHRLPAWRRASSQCDELDAFSSCMYCMRMSNGAREPGWYFAAQTEVSLATALLPNESIHDLRAIPSCRSGSAVLILCVINRRFAYSLSI